MTEKLSLTELQQIIRDSLYISLPDMYWVTAEISEIKENFSGHCYLELIEKNPVEQNITSKVRAIIWSNRYRFLKILFRDVTGEQLCEGLKILVKVKIEYHELYGLSLVITDIDPAYTVGEMALKRQEIIRKLEVEGVFTMNKEISFPVAPQRIAIISSRNAAGFTDFENHLKNNSFGYVFYTLLFESPMQGTDMEEGILSAMNRIASNIEMFDLVVIIRGGGSQSDLSWFDNYNIAYYITQFPIPVITGIGHEKDISVADMVANISLKTPTAVANYLIDSLASTEEHLSTVFSGISESARRVLEINRSKLESSALRIPSLTNLLISKRKELLSGLIFDLVNLGKESIYKASQVPANQKSKLFSFSKMFLSEKDVSIVSIQQRIKTESANYLKGSKIKLEGIENSLQILKPESVLKRGYTITFLNGKILKSAEGLKSEEIIETLFYDRKIRSRIEKGQKK
jgi:exodeoxyribonuclease VII large subunit